VFEVVHPATHTWQRKRLAQIGLNIPVSLTFPPVDLKHQGLSIALVSVGHKPDRPAFFHWLGVVPYLPREVITSTLRFIVSVPGSGIVFDYTEPLGNYPEACSCWRRRTYCCAG
jgi:O-methyltransferase involved in polyketide biosynthesis